MRATVRQQFDDEQGFVLPIVIGAIALVTVFAVGGYALANQSVERTTILETEDRAFQVASSGLDREIADFRLTDIQGGTGIVHEAEIGDGRYISTIEQLGGSRYSIICTGTVGDQTARVRTDFFYLDLWGMSIATGDSGRTPGSAGDWNGGAKIDGPFYVANGDFNSNLDLVGGPFFSAGNINFKGGVNFYPRTVNDKYYVYAGGTCSESTGGSIVVVNSSPSIDLPWVDPDYLTQMLAKAKAQSNDNKLGDGNPSVISTEVASGTYVGVKAAGATSDYKVINGPLTIDSVAFGQITKTAGKVTGSDDFAYDPTTGILCVEGVVYVKGAVTLGPNISQYRGSGIILSEDVITVDTGSWATGGGNGTFQPQDGNPSTSSRSGAVDLSSQKCLGLVGMKGVTMKRDAGFEGIVFTNGTFLLEKGTRFEGAVHAQAINAEPNQVELFMEDLESRKISITSVLPDGIPGSPSDPRPGGAASAALFAPGTWSRVQ